MSTTPTRSGFAILSPLIFQATRKNQALPILSTHRPGRSATLFIRGGLLLVSFFFRHSIVPGLRCSLDDMPRPTHMSRVSVTTRKGLAGYRLSTLFLYAHSFPFLT